jgi:hypothetical protein
MLSEGSTSRVEVRPVGVRTKICMGLRRPGDGTGPAAMVLSV